MSLGERIRDRRNTLDMSQSELAERMGYNDRSTIAKIESGKNDLNQSKIKQMAECLQTTPEYLMGWTDDPYDYDKDPDGIFSEIPIAQFEALKDECCDNMRLVWMQWEKMQKDTFNEVMADKSIEHQNLCKEQDNDVKNGSVIDANFNQETPTERKLKLLARHLDKVPDEQRERLIKNFEDSIDIYLDAVGIPKEDE